MTRDGIHETGMRAPPAAAPRAKWGSQALGGRDACARFSTLTEPAWQESSPVVNKHRGEKESSQTAPEVWSLESRGWTAADWRTPNPKLESQESASRVTTEPSRARDLKGLRVKWGPNQKVQGKDQEKQGGAWGPLLLHAAPPRPWQE